MKNDDFEAVFKILTGYAPLGWQKRLYDEFSQKRIPSQCTIPTGLGKTNVVAIWLIALLNHSTIIPRRLIYVVNRRTVVDQTTNEVEKLKVNFNENKQNLDPWFDDFAVSTLRGQYADNHEWSTDPSRPGVICGTVDMIGSRLLFSGYRIGFKSYPMHAGFLGQDALLIHDEAHLEPAFQTLIETIQREQQIESTCLPWSKLRVMAMSATTRNNSDSLSIPFGLDLDDIENFPIIKRRYNAVKKLHLRSCENEKKNLVNEVTNTALDFKNTGSAILIFARHVDDVEKISSELIKFLKKEKLQENVVSLTGAMRGYERDELVRNNGIFARFLSDKDRSTDIKLAEGSCYLVCTSAGEVGINISANHLICDLSTFDSMVQRFGRVNRFGDKQDSQIHVIHPDSFGKTDKKNELDKLELSRQKTLQLLKDLDGNANSAAIHNLDKNECMEAFSPKPVILPATSILFDAWAMTSIRNNIPGRPPVEPYLHGVAEWDPPRTSLAWRQEVDCITNDIMDFNDLDLPRKILEDFPLKPHEILSDVSNRIVSKLKVMFDNQSIPKNVWIIESDGNTTITSTTDLLKELNKNKNRLDYRTLILPPSAGGLSRGLLDQKSDNADDVSEQWFINKRQCRIRIWDDQNPPVGMVLMRTIDTDPNSDELETLIGESNKHRFWHWFMIPRYAENSARSSKRPVTFNDHTEAVVECATELVKNLGLPEDLQQVVVASAKYHDLGKQREIWQRSIGNPNPGIWYAKSGIPENGPRWRPQRLSYYRHEFGSLLDVSMSDSQSNEEFSQLPESMKELVLHLIASHHGYARPHFPVEKTVDPIHTQEAANEASMAVIRRFVYLQSTFGRWGLAYLESLLRAADWSASSNIQDENLSSSGE